MIDTIALWFHRAKPEPLDRDRDIQIGVDAEEVAEMLETLKGRDVFSDGLIRQAEDAMKRLATGLKTGMAQAVIVDREGYLDACCDKIVTATGCAALAGMHIAMALEEVNSSNWSKFDADGQPIFDEDGKIAKNPETYRKANLKGMF